MRNYDNMLEKLYKNTHKFIEIVQNRIQKRLENEIEEKKKKLPEWRKGCEQNFTKSLDHLSFIFKQIQKNKSRKSAIEDEIKRIEAQNPSAKSLNELKGGNSAENEFFCTFSNLNMGVSRVYNDLSLQDPRLIQDFPINMAVSEEVLRTNSHALPQMRFLLNNAQVLNLTAQVLFSKARLGTSSASDSSKIAQIKKFFAVLFQSFFAIELTQDKAGEDIRLASLSDDDVDLIANE